jgi:hypothetical protein
MQETFRSTPFSLWIREIPELSSKIGYRNFNLDYVWANRTTGQYLLLEEKRFGSIVRAEQQWTFTLLDLGLSHDPNYYGFHILTLSKELPIGWREKIQDIAFFLTQLDKEPLEDQMRLDGREITINELIEFLSFQSHEEHYRSFCDPLRKQELEEAIRENWRK